jgi:hypothetical protein
MYSNFEPIDKLCLVQVAYGATAGWGKHSRLLHSSRILILARLFFFFFYRYIRSMFLIIAIVVIMTKKVKKNLYVIVCVSLYFLFSFYGSRAV